MCGDESGDILVNSLDVQIRDSLRRVRVKRITEFIGREWERDKVGDVGFGV